MGSWSHKVGLLVSNPLGWPGRARTRQRRDSPWQLNHTPGQHSPRCPGAREAAGAWALWASGPCPALLLSAALCSQGVEVSWHICKGQCVSIPRRLGPALMWLYVEGKNLPGSECRQPWEKTECGKLGAGDMSQSGSGCAGPAACDAKENCQAGWPKEAVKPKAQHTLREAALPWGQFTEQMSDLAVLRALR